MELTNDNIFFVNKSRRLSKNIVSMYYDGDNVDLINDRFVTCNESKIRLGAIHYKIVNSDVLVIKYLVCYSRWEECTPLDNDNDTFSNEIKKFLLRYIFLSKIYISRIVCDLSNYIDSYLRQLHSSNIINIHIYTQCSHTKSKPSFDRYTRENIEFVGGIGELYAYDALSKTKLGFVEFHVENTGCVIIEYIKSEYKRRGIGRLLLVRITEIYGDNISFTGAPTVSALPFWEKMRDIFILSMNLSLYDNTECVCNCERDQSGNLDTCNDDYYSSGDDEIYYKSLNVKVTS